MGARDVLPSMWARVARIEMKNRKPAEPRPAMRSQERAGRYEASLGRDIRGKIGQQLRAMYDDVVGQGVPDRFRDLLEKLEQHSKKK
jgi:hypothetical protein